MRIVGGKEHVIVDARQRLGSKGIGLYNLLEERYGDLGNLYNGKSQYILPRLFEGEPSFEFALIDGAHTLDHTLIDFFFLDNMLRVGGILAIDDADWPGIRKVCDFIARNRHYEVVDYEGAKPGSSFWESPKSSMVAFRKTDNDILGKTRMFDHFVDF